METGGAGVLITRGTRVVETFGAGVVTLVVVVDTSGAWVVTLVVVVDTRVVVTFGAGVVTTGRDVVVMTLAFVVVTGVGGGGGSSSSQPHFKDLISSSMYLNSHESARTIHLCQTYLIFVIFFTQPQLKAKNFYT